MTHILPSSTASHARPAPVSDPLDLLLADLRDTVGEDLRHEAAADPDGNALARALLSPMMARGLLDADAMIAGLAPGVAGYQDKAARLLQHRVSLLGGYEEQDLGERIDWFRAPGNDLQWPTHLSRHYWLLPLAWMYRLTGDERYAQKVIDVLLDFTDRCGVDSPAYESHRGSWSLRWADQPQPPTVVEGHFPGYTDGPWTSLSAHSRVDAWTQLFQLLYDARTMTNRRLAPLLLSLMHQHLDLMLAYPRQMNQYLAIASSLARIGMCYPVFPQAELARQTGWSRVAKWAQREIYPDGSIAECSPNYAMGSLHYVFEVIRQAERTGTPVPDDLDERVRMGARYMAYCATPGGRSPRIAKGGLSVKARLGQINTRYGDEEVRFTTSGYQQGAAPRDLARVYPWAGHVIMRSDWTPAATWIFFEPGPRGAGHHDLACLNLQLAVGDRWLLTDPGYYTYGGEGTATTIADYLHTSFAHNVAVVDGQGQRRCGAGEEPGPNAAPGDYRFSDDGRHVRAQGVYAAGFGDSPGLDVVHHRALHYDRIANALHINDAFTGKGAHRYDLHWHFPPDADLQLQVNRLVARVGGTLLTMTFKHEGPVEMQCIRGRLSPPMGWYSEKYGQVAAAPAVCVSVTGDLPRHIDTHLTITTAPGGDAASAEQ